MLFVYYHSNYDIIYNEVLFGVKSIMKIYRDYDSKNYNNTNQKYGNCFTVKNNNEYFYYDFTVSKHEATINTNELKYIDLAINEFRKYNSYISIFKTMDNSFYKTFDEKHTFKLPINIIQVSHFFLNQKKIDIFENMNLDEIYIPVAIINDEYVCLDGHHRLYEAYINNMKMVNVYLEKYDNYVNDFIYFAKENQLFKITDLTILSDDEYKEKWDGFCTQYFSIIR